MAKFTSPAWRFIGHVANQIHLEKWSQQNRWLAVLFHHLTDGIKWRADDPLIRGLNIDIPVDAFKERMRWIIERYEVVPLDIALDRKASAARRPKLLICFDDGYASVAELAAPILRDMDLPWCFFINPSFVGNSTLSVDNIVAYIANVYGTEPLSNAAATRIESARDFIGNYLSNLAPSERDNTIQLLAIRLNIDIRALAKKSRLFVEESQIRALANSGVEIGNHTRDHVHCRTLDPTGAIEQIEASAREVAGMSGRPVRAFAYPYGSTADATPLARRVVKRSGHECAFVVHNRSNSTRTDRFALYRVDVGEMDDSRAALELEVLSRMRGAFAEIRAGIGM